MLEYYSKKGSRKKNEDYVYIKRVNKTFILAVFDGHAGTECINLFINLFELNFKIDTLSKKYITYLFVSIDRKMLERNISSGASVTMVIIHHNDTYVIQLGDTKGIFFYNNAIIYETPEHNFFNNEEYNRCYKDLIVVNKMPRYLGTLNLTRTLGDSDIKNKSKYLIANPKIKLLSTKSYNIIILCSDGVYKKYKPTWNSNIKNLISLCANLKYSDNCTILKLQQNHNVISTLNKLIK